MSHRTRQQVIADFRTADILEAARSIFASRGYSEATVEDIAQAAGVAKGTVYLYYPSKADVYWAALKDGIQALHKKLKTEMARPGTVQEKVQRYIRVKVEYFYDNHNFFKIYFSEFGHAFVHPAALQKEFTDLYRKQAALLRTVLEEGVRSKVLRKIHTDATAYAISDLTRSVITHKLLKWSHRKIQDDIEFVFDLIWKGIATT